MRELYLFIQMFLPSITLTAADELLAVFQTNVNA